MTIMIQKREKKDLKPESTHSDKRKGKLPLFMLVYQQEQSTVLSCHTQIKGSTKGRKIQIQFLKIN